jgi:hypothetical protein
MEIKIHRYNTKPKRVLYIVLYAYLKKHRVYISGKLPTTLVMSLESLHGDNSKCHEHL